MRRHHGDESLFYFADKDKTYETTLTPNGPTLLETTLVNKTQVFRYGRLYKTRQLKKLSLDLNLLTDLGNAMVSNTPDTDDTINKKLPAGYTYLGQFVAHDMSFNPKGLSVSMKTAVNGRSPTLDLDSLYGDEEGPHSENSEHLYEEDKRRLKVGYNAPINDGYRNDLLRDTTDPENQPALIADERNDENLAVAQTHLAFTKFHNAVVTELEKSGKFSEDQLFEEARKRVTQHYQWIILKDFLPKIIQPDILKNYIRRGNKCNPWDPNNPPYMPIEFAFAAFRLGHSMVAGVYSWNKNFGNATLRDLFLNTGNTGYMLGALPSKWMIDWTRFFDFTAHGLKPQNLNFAEKINTSLTSGMRRIAGLPTNPQTSTPFSLASLNLIKGNLMELPSGQAVARAYKEKVLTPEQILDNNPHAEILERGNLQKNTPLWYYILKEAELIGNGEHLGKVGSRIVATTFVGLISRSRTSILKGKDRWAPSKDEKGFVFGRGDIFEMTDLLSFTGELNPLGN